jgi:Na+-translocating ferredoxin:NAD+ oxidoreductase RnfG subunit
MKKYQISNFLIATTVYSSSAYAVENLSIEQVQKIFFSDASKFEDVSLNLNSDQMDEIKKISGLRQRNSQQKVWRAYAKDKLIGTIFLDEVVGKHEFITYATAVSPTGEVIGIEILNYRETHGHEVKRKDWRDKFKGKKLSDPFKLDVDVPNISGATLSCRNLLDGVKRLLTIYQLYLSK